MKARFYHGSKFCPWNLVGECIPQNPANIKAGKHYDLTRVLTGFVILFYWTALCTGCFFAMENFKNKLADF